MGRVFAVEDEKRFAWLLVFEELSSKLFLIVEVYGAVYVAAFVLVLKPTVNDYSLLVDVIEFTVKDIDHRLFRDSWQITRLVTREEVWQVWLVWCFDISNGW